MKVYIKIIIANKYRNSRNKWMCFSIFLLFLDFALSLLLLLFDYISFKDEVKVQKKLELLIEISLASFVFIVLFILMLIKRYFVELICIISYIVIGSSYWVYFFIKAIILIVYPETGKLERKKEFFDNEKQFSIIIFLVLIGLLRIGVNFAIKKYINNVKKLKGFAEERNTEILINTIETKKDSGSFINWNDSLHANNM